MLLLLAACTGKPLPDGDSGPVVTDTAPDEDTGGDTGDTVPEDLGDPYLAMVAAVAPGILLESCVMGMTVTADGETVAAEELAARGGEWVGASLSGESQYSAVASWTECTKLNPTGTVESGAFSGVAGSLFLLWYNGANAGYTTVEQTVDYRGGQATITLDAGADTTGIMAIAEANNVVLTAGAEPDTWDAGFPTEVPVGQVLAAFSADPAFLEGSPAWIDAPYWW